MDFTIPSKTLRAAVDAAADPLPRRTGVLPALTYLRVDAHADGRTTYQGTDLEFAVHAEAAAEVRAPGSLCLPGNQFQDIVDKCDPEAAIRVRAVGTGCVIESGGSRFRLAADAATDYVGGPGVPGEPAFTVPGDTLRTMAGRVAWVASTEETRGLLCGVLMETTSSAWRMVATNGHRLALTKHQSTSSRMARGTWFRPSSSAPPYAC